MGQTVICPLHLPQRLQQSGAVTRPPASAYTHSWQSLLTHHTDALCHKTAQLSWSDCNLCSLSWITKGQLHRPAASGFSPFASGLRTVSGPIKTGHLTERDKTKKCFCKLPKTQITRNHQSESDLKVTIFSNSREQRSGTTVSCYRVKILKGRTPCWWWGGKDLRDMRDFDCLTGKLNK